MNRRMSKREKVHYTPYGGENKWCMLCMRRISNGLHSSCRIVGLVGIYASCDMFKGVPRANVCASHGCGSQDIDIERDKPQGEAVCDVCHWRKRAEKEEAELADVKRAQVRRDAIIAALMEDGE